MTDAPPRALAWDWPRFGLGLALAVPALIVIPFNTLAGLGLALGVMPAAAFPLPPTRRARSIIPVMGAMCALAIVLGSLLTQVPALAVVGIFVLAVGASLIADRGPLARLALALALPLTGIGLSFSNIASALLIGCLMLAGSVYAWALSLLWPERAMPAATRGTAPSRRDMLTYGILLGLAGASAAAIGYLLHLDHVGWATGAALLVMRPARNLLILRSVGRAVSVLIGALAAAVFAMVGVSGIASAVVIALVLASLAATQTSRWYVAPGFTSFIALTLVIDTDDLGAIAHFNERTLETLLGVGLALFFGALVPAALLWWRSRRTATKRHPAPPA